MVRRGNRILTCEITPIRALRTDLFGRNTTDYLLGIYLEDPAAGGVGTMSFYDPNSGRFGALGHAITDSLSRPIRIVSGSIVEASIDSVRVGARGGSPGEKVGFFHGGEQDVLGSIDSNSGFGIFGQLRQSFRHPFFPEPVPVAFAHQVREGGPLKFTPLFPEAASSVLPLILSGLIISLSPAIKALSFRLRMSACSKQRGALFKG